MKKIILVLLATAAMGLSVKSFSATTMICQTISGQQFVWVGTSCPPGSIFISY